MSQFSLFCHNGAINALAENYWCEQEDVCNGEFIEEAYRKLEATIGSELIWRKDNLMTKSYKHSCKDPGRRFVVNFPLNCT